MISDVLSDAVIGINLYLRSSEYDDVYSGWLRDEIVRVRNEMLAIGGFLDTPPDTINKTLTEGQTELDYYEQLKEKCLKIEAVYPDMVAPDDA
jgi:hypothetical protein